MHCRRFFHAHHKLTEFYCPYKRIINGTHFIYNTEHGKVNFNNTYHTNDIPSNIRGLEFGQTNRIQKYFKTILKSVKTQPLSGIYQKNYFDGSVKQMWLKCLLALWFKNKCFNNIGVILKFVFYLFVFPGILY